MQKQKIKEHLDHFHIAGFTYYDGVEAFESLKIGTKLSLLLDPDNKFDPRAVAIYFKDCKLGYIPRNNNRIFYKLLRTHHKNIDVKIQSINGQQSPEEQIQVVAHLTNYQKQ